MKKFLEFIKELMGPLVTHIFMFVFGMVMFGWVLSLFGLLLLFEPTTPIWLKWVIGILDSFCLIMVIYSWIYRAWKRVYKQN
jgi:hypothetical protein